MKLSEKLMRKIGPRWKLQDKTGTICEGYPWIDTAEELWRWVSG